MLATIQSRGSTSFSFLTDPFPHATLLLIIWYYCLSLLSKKKNSIFLSPRPLLFNYFWSLQKNMRPGWDQHICLPDFHSSTRQAWFSLSLLFNLFLLSRQKTWFSLSLLFNLCLLSRQNTCFSLSFLISFYSLFLSILLAKIFLSLPVLARKLSKIYFSFSHFYIQS